MYQCKTCPQSCARKDRNRLLQSGFIEYLDLRVASTDDAITNGAYESRAVRSIRPSNSVHAHQASEKKNVPFIYLARFHFPLFAVGGETISGCNRLS